MAPKIKIPRHGKTPIGGFFSPGVFSDGGGFVIYPGHDGKLHIKYIPPREPVLTSVNLAASLAALAERAGNEAFGKQLRGMAETILNADGQQIANALANIQGDA